MIPSSRVHELFKKSLFNEVELINGKPSLKPVVAEGVLINVGFHPERIENAREEISMMIDSLNPDIDTDKGILFFHICRDRNGNRWTDSYQICEELVLMGIALGILEYSLPRDFWSFFPGSVPFIRKRIHLYLTSKNSLVS